MCVYIYIYACPYIYKKAMAPTPVLLPGKSHGWRSLVGCSPWGRWESDTTERLHFHFSFSCIGEGNGNPLQCSCLENPRDGGAWCAAVYGVAQSCTQLKQLSSSNSSALLQSLCFLMFRLLKKSLSTSIFLAQDVTDPPHADPALDLGPTCFPKSLQSSVWEQDLEPRI